jgi:hypothetical protein
MITDAKTAKMVSDLMLQTCERLIGSTELVNAACSPEEALEYKRAIGRIVYEIHEAVFQPLYGRHPELKPPGFD